MWNICTMEFYSAIKKDEIMPFAAPWMGLESIILTMSDREKQISSDITYMWNLGFSRSSAGKESTCDAGDPGLIPGSERSTGEGIGYPLQYSWTSWWLSWERISLHFGRPGFNSWVGKILWRREWLPTLVFWPGEFHGLYNPWDRKELNTTEQRSLSYVKSNNKWYRWTYLQARNWLRDLQIKCMVTKRETLREVIN